ncbi:MAG: hypothetical protein U1E73_03370 [Planctomycetota bacterium]
MRAGTDIAAGLLLLAACTSTPQDPPSLAAGSQLVEQRRGEERVVPRGTVSSADPRSDLVLRFAKPGGPAAPSAAGIDGVVQVLAQAEQMMAEQKRLITAFETGAALTGEQLEAMHAESARFSAKVVKLVTTLLANGFTQADVRAVNADRVAHGEDNAYPALLRLLRAKYAVERDALAAARAAANEREVTVQARIESNTAKSKYLHIEGYDDLAVGDMKPRYGGFLGASSDEIAALEGRLRTAERAAGLLRSILGSGADLRAGVNRLRDALRAALVAAREQLPGEPAGVIAALRTPLQARAEAEPATATDTPAKAALRALDRLAKTVDDGREAKAKIDAVLQAFAAGPDRTLSQLLAALGRDVGELAGAVGKVVVDLRGLPDVATSLARGLTANGLEPPAELEPALQQLRAAAKPVLELAALLAAVTGGDEAAAGGEATPPPGDDHALFLPLATARDARIPLGETDVAEGNRVHVEAIYRPIGSVDPRDRLVETWDAEIQRFGFFPRIGAELVFSRADTGTADARSWKPNAAAVAEVHYRFQDPDTAGAVWNFLDPSLGVHLASLDQGDQNVEFGMGVNASLFGGFLTAGVGRNLSVDSDPTYWFVGIDLIEVLSGAQGLLGGK